MSTKANLLNELIEILPTHLVIIADPVTGKLYRSTVSALLALANAPEIIAITNEATKSFTWTPTRIASFGSFPTAELWLLDADSLYYKSAIQPSIDAQPPDFTTMRYDFGGNVTGFIMLK